MRHGATKLDDLFAIVQVMESNRWMKAKDRLPENVCTVSLSVELSHTVFFVINSGRNFGEGG